MDAIGPPIIDIVDPREQEPWTNFNLYTGAWSYSDGEYHPVFLNMKLITYEECKYIVEQKIEMYMKYGYVCAFSDAQLEFVTMFITFLNGFIIVT